MCNTSWAPTALRKEPSSSSSYMSDQGLRNCHTSLVPANHSVHLFLLQQSLDHTFIWIWRKNVQYQLGAHGIEERTLIVQLVHVGPGAQKLPHVLGARTDRSHSALTADCSGLSG